MFRLIEKSISTAYTLVRQSKHQNAGLPSGIGVDFVETTNDPVCRSFIDLPNELFEMLSSAGPYLYRDTLLLQKVYFY